MNSLEFEVFGHEAPSKKLETRLHIVKCSVPLFCKYGVDGLSYSELAKSAQKTRALVQNYFPDRNELFRFAVKYVRHKYLEYVLSCFKGIKSPQKAFCAYVRAALEWKSAHPVDSRFWLLFLQRSSVSSKERKLNSELSEKGAQRIVGFIEKNFSRKTLAYGAAKQIQASITGNFVLIHTEDSTLTTRKLTNLCVEECLNLASF